MSYDKKVLFRPFKKQQELYAAVACRKYDFILYGGSIRGGKTMGMLGLFLWLSAKYPNSRFLVVRKSLQRLKDTVLPTFYQIRPSTKTVQDPNQSNSWEWKHVNGSVIKFYAENIERDPELKRFRGLEYDSIYFDEMDIQEKTFFIGFERCGTWRMKDRMQAQEKGEMIPPQVVLGSSNPQGGWVKQLIYSPWVKGTLKPNWLYIPSRVYDNPHIPQEWIDRQRENLLPERFAMMVDGDWELIYNDKPFFNHFVELRHVVEELEIDPNHPLYLGFDYNYNPASVIGGQMVRGKGINILFAYQENGGTDALLENKLKWLQTLVIEGKIQLVWTGDNNGNRKESSSMGLTDFMMIERFFGVPVCDVAYGANPLHEYSRIICNQVLLKCNALFHKERCKGLISELKDTRTNDRGKIDKKHLDPHLVDGWRYLQHLWFSSVKEVITFADTIIERKKEITAIQQAKADHQAKLQAKIKVRRKT